MGIEEDVLSIVQMQPVAIMNGVDIESDAESQSFIPKTKANVCYICGTVLFDEAGSVLLIQEAKKSCFGTWYLPAGRLEPGETIVDGAKREVKEESGLECDLTTLISVEINSYKWMRFTFLGRVTGGKLKTVEQRDSESLQAKFFSQQELKQSHSSLRHTDILKLIDVARKYLASSPATRHFNVLPVLVPHSQLIHRVVIVDRSQSSSEGSGQGVHLLARKDHAWHIPTALINHNKESLLAVSVYAILRDAFSTNLSVVSIRMCGILGIEHRGTGTNEDGLCVTTLVSLDLTSDIAPPSVTSQQYQWQAVRQTDLTDRLNRAVKGQMVPLL